MTRLTQPLRDEHKELIPHIEALREAADSIGQTSPEAARKGVREAYAFLAHHLLVHAEAEERALYPIVGALLGGPRATATMERDHVEIRRLTEELDTLRRRMETAASDEDVSRALRRVLYGLYALVKAHFAKEEEVYLPILDANLTQAKADELFRSMADAAAAARRAQG